MATTAINSIPIPELTDPPHITNSIQPLANQIDSRLVSRFSTLAQRNAAITSPEAGMMCWVTETSELYLYDGVAYVSAKPRIKYKTVVESRTSNTYQNDAELFLPIEVSSDYLVRFLINTDGSTTGDFKMDWVAPAGATNLGGSAGSGGAFYFTTSDLLTLTRMNLDSGAFTGIGGSNVWRPIVGEFMFSNSTNTGNLQLQWAQNVTSGTTRIGEGSYMEVWKVS